MTGDWVSASTFNVREEMKRFMQFHRKLPIVLSIAEVAGLLAAVPGPGLKYRAALGTSYGAGLRASEMRNLKVNDIVPKARLRHDSDRMLIHVDDGRLPVFRRIGERTKGSADNKEQDFS